MFTAKFTQVNRIPPQRNSHAWRRLHVLDQQPRGIAERITTYCQQQPACALAQGFAQAGPHQPPQFPSDGPGEGGPRSLPPSRPSGQIAHACKQNQPGQ